MTLRVVYVSQIGFVRVYISVIKVGSERADASEQTLFVSIFSCESKKASERMRASKRYL